ncbi:MAG: hypothetical protein EOO39_02330 [Cytophagaceae bacterium]|nr:MAG: hypothetical protein EOO39_02330 [Cytophagaceae bacterium]
MSTIQQLQQIVSQLPDTYQQDLLAYAQDMLHELEETLDVDDSKVREQKLQQLILDRYVAYKQSGQKGRPLSDVLTDLRSTYGLR